MKPQPKADIGCNFECYFQVTAASAAGFERAIADDSFERLFKQHYGRHIKRAAIGRRRIIELSNPSRPPETPLARKALWLRLP